MKQIKKALYVASLALLFSSLGFEAAMAATETDADPALQFVTKIGLGIGMGALISAVATGSEPATKWNNRKFAYGMLIAIFSCFAVVDGFKEPISYTNALGLILQIAGASFFTNGGLKIAQRVKGNGTTKAG